MVGTLPYPVQALLISKLASSQDFYFPAVAGITPIDNFRNGAIAAGANIVFIEAAIADTGRWYAYTRYLGIVNHLCPRTQLISILDENSAVSHLNRGLREYFC